jgi:hypothetical protein
VLFLVTLALNFVALRVVKRFREAYDFPSSDLSRPAGDDSARPSRSRPALGQCVEFERRAVRSAEAADAAIWARHSRLFAGESPGIRLRVREAADRPGTGWHPSLWLPAASEIDMAAKEPGTSPPKAPYRALQTLQPRLPHPLRRHRSAPVGIWGALKGSMLTMIVTLAAGLPDRRSFGALSRGIRAPEPLDRR